MHLTLLTPYRAALVWLPALVLSGCGQVDPNAGGPPGSTDGQDTDANATRGPLTDTGATDTDSPGDTDSPTHTDTDTTTTTDADTDTDDSETFGDTESPDSTCDDMGLPQWPLVEVDRSDWPSSTKNDFIVLVEFDVACTITDVATVANQVVTTMDCDDAGTPRGFQVAIPPADDPVAWAAGETVQVAYSYRELDYDFGIFRNDVSIRRTSDGALLLASMDQETINADTFAPLTVTADEDHCAPADGGFEETWNLLIGVNNGLGSVADVAHMERGELEPNSGEGLLVIDVGEARVGLAYCCHATRHIEALVRRTLPR
ncbi:MAG: hypothetical protein K0V04_04665 [Deltaproteobacteria bacterium]|nr:hypothetical protein [Deltaproteobacteria bacterium]